jgi:ribosomal protein L11 methyltransferase
MDRHAPGCVSIEEPVIQPLDGDGAHIDYDAPVMLRAYVPVDGSQAGKLQAVAEALWHLSRIEIPNFGVGEVSSRELAEEDWANAWKEHYSVRKVGRRLVIKPSWLDYVAGLEDVVVELDPGMAFGTGLHPTTDTCLQLLEDLVHGGETVLDLGTGSGILSLAAAGLGAGPILALDTDEVAVRTAETNLASLGERVEVGQGSLPLAHHTSPPVGGEGIQQFDLVLANIIARVLVDLARDLAAVLAPAGKLLASGIIDEREAEVVEAFAAAGLAVERRVQSGNWVTLECSHPR